MRKLKAVKILFAFMLMLAAGSCKKDPEPANPYDSINYGTNGDTAPEPDPNSIAGLHKNIFSPRCANPGCHDGTFEPDFRTIESSYATLVYQPVNKVTLDSAKIFSLRAIPFNVDDSWINERLTTSTSEYMPSNGIRLTPSQITNVQNWINNGCRDANGNVAVKPNLQPNIIGYVALDPSNNRLDTSRVDDFPFNPFIVPSGSTMTIAFLATDTADGADGTDPSQFQGCKIRFSTDKNDFTSAQVIPAITYLAQFQAWLVSVPVTSWTAGTTVYFRIYVNDLQHSADAEFPRLESIDYYKTLYAFYVQ